MAHAPDDDVVRPERSALEGLLVTDTQEERGSAGATERADRLAEKLEVALRRARLTGDVARALTGTAPLAAQLTACVQSMVASLDAAFARLWTVSVDAASLELQASAGLYTHIDGPHRRVPVGAFKIGRIAAERAPHLTNDVPHDPWVSDPDWAVREGMVGFAGYPLLVEARLVGVIAMFSRAPIPPETLDTLASVADIIALGIERRRAEVAEAQARASLAITLRSIGDAVIATDTELGVTFMNPVAEMLTGWTLDVARGRHLESVFRILHDVTRLPVEIPAIKVLRDGETVGLPDHTVLVARDGREVGIDDSSAPIRDASGALTGVVLVFRDVTRQRAELDRRQFLAEAGAALATVLDVKKTLATLAELAVPRLADWCTIDMVCEDGRTTEQVAVAHVDPSKVSIAVDLGRPYPASSDTGVARVIRTGQSELYAHLPDELLAASAVDAEHLRILHALKLRSAMIVPLRARDRVLGAMTFVYAESSRRYDTEALQFAEELSRRAAIAVDNANLYESERLARRHADEANRAKDDFLATVSHELRTPLNAMLGWTRLMRSGGLSEERRVRALETIERNAVNQAQLVEDLLDVSRIVSGKLRLDVQPIDISRVLADALESVKPASDQRNILIERTTDSSMGPMMGDAHRLQQVIWNLLSNAIKFSPKGGRIQVSLARKDTLLEVVVADSGRGIPASLLPHVFERFKQGDGATTRVYGGLGLGLAISRHIVELHGGTIDVESEGEDRGATFTVRLPVSPARQESGESSSRRANLASVPPPENRPELRGLKVLVVDDDDDARDLLVTVLESAGSIVTSASRADDALEKLKQDPPHVLVSDLGMPGEDGYSLIRRVRALGPAAGGDVPAAALTAYARAEDRRKALDAGFMMHVTKPVEPSELLAVIANLTRFAVRR